MAFGREIGGKLVCDGSNQVDGRKKVRHSKTGWVVSMEWGQLIRKMARVCLREQNGSRRLDGEEYLGLWSQGVKYEYEEDT